MNAYHPDLRLARFIPPLSFGPRSTRLMNRIPFPTSPAPSDLVIENLTVPGPDGAPDVPVRIYRRRAVTGDTPAMMWIHGGGMVSGSNVMDEASLIAFVRSLGITIVSADYRLAPEHPAPAALEDSYAVLRWMHENAAARGIDPARIAIGGASAGGGLAAGVAQMALDRGELPIVFQLLVYPMIDDRTAVRTDQDTRWARGWTPKSNVFGWTSYLGQAPGAHDVDPYAAPARRSDLSGLPPAWIGVGTLDLFHDEDVDYAARLRLAGVPAELEIVEGAFHGFDAMFRDKPVTKRFWTAQRNALNRALFR